MYCRVLTTLEGARGHFQVVAVGHQSSAGARIASDSYSTTAQLDFLIKFCIQFTDRYVAVWLCSFVAL